MFSDGIFICGGCLGERGVKGVGDEYVGGGKLFLCSVTHVLSDSGVINGVRRQKYRLLK